MSETREIPLTQSKVAIVDAADYEFLSQWSRRSARRFLTAECLNAHWFDTLLEARQRIEVLKAGIQ